MALYRIVDSVTFELHSECIADSPEDALDLMAQASRYTDAEHMRTMLEIKSWDDVVTVIEVRETFTAADINAAFGGTQ